MAKKSKPKEDDLNDPSASAKSADSPPKQASAHYIVFARRFRPDSFAEVVGQGAVTGALRQALTSGRVAQAYLFCGPRGVGKTSLARILAKAVNCLKGKGPNGTAEEPCNDCEACRSVQEGRALDVIEMDAATNRGIEEIRSLRDNVGLAPAQLRYKVYIIDEVHMLTKEAWNAFLKTLEEPPPHVKFIFATTDPNNVPETILSRCQRYDLRRIGPADIVKRLKQICVQEKIDADEMALSRIANLARGGLRDAEGLLDQAVNLSAGKVTDAVVRDLAGAAPDELMLEIIKACAQGHAGEVLVKTHSALESGADPEDMLNALIERLRGTLLVKVCGAETPLLEGQSHLKEAYSELAGLLSEDQLMMLIQLFTAARRQMRDAAQARLPLEMALLRAARAKDLVDLGKLVSALEAGGSSKPPGRAPEGPRPNSSGRSAGDESRPAAERVSVAQSAAPREAPLQAGADVRARVLTALRAQKGTAVLVSALTYASLVELDVDGGSLKLGFAPEQLFYTDAMGRAEAQQALQQALSTSFGRAFQIRVERLTAAQASSATVHVPRFTQRPPARQPEENFGVESEVEFDSGDELPLRATVPATRAEAAPEPESDDEDAPAPHTPALPAVQAVTGRPAQTRYQPVDAKEVEKHPLVQLLIKETGGQIMNVRREVKAGQKDQGKP